MTAITISDVTTGSLEGSGVFDELMKVTSLHIQRELEAGRILGTDYATVYLGAMQTVLAQSIGFVLGKDKAAYDADLVAAQVLLVKAQEGAVAHTNSKTDAEKLNIEASTLKVQADTTLANKELLRVDKEIEVLSEQIEKILKEAALITQKALTEVAQISDTVDGVDVTGVIGKQKKLYQAQIDGFARDAEQKFSKIMADIYAVQRGTDEGLPPPTGADNVDISKVLQKAAEGIGVSTTI